MDLAVPRRHRSISSEVRDFLSDCSLGLALIGLYYLGILTSQTLTPGLYKWTSAVTVTTSLTLKGSATDGMSPRVPIAARCIY